MTFQYLELFWGEVVEFSLQLCLDLVLELSLADSILLSSPDVQWERVEFVAVTSDSVVSVAMVLLYLDIKGAAAVMPPMIADTGIVLYSNKQLPSVDQGMIPHSLKFCKCMSAY